MIERWSERIVERFKESETARRLTGEVIFHLLAKGVEIEGLENLPSPPYIVAFNHMAWAEAPVFVAYLPDPPYFMGKVEVSKIRPLSFFLKKMGYFPVRRGEVDRQAIRTTIHLLEEDKVLALALEGTRGRGKERTALKPVKAGAIYLARKANVPIIPIAVWGTENILPLIEEEGTSLSEILSLIQPFSPIKEKIHVRIGEPFMEHLSLPEKPLNSKIMMPYAHQLMLRIRDLLPEKYHGYYADWEQKEG